MQSVQIKVGQNGRIVIPAEFRRSLHLAEGDEVVLVLEPDAVRIMSTRAAVHHVQQVFAQYHVKQPLSASEELIRERKKEVKREKAKS